MTPRFERDIVILDGARTPVGTFGGAFKQTTATQLGVVTARAALERATVAPEDVGNVIFGNVLQTSYDAVYQARHIALQAGIPREVPALTVNRLCGSGLQAVISAAQSLLLDEAQVALAGGT